MLEISLGCVLWLEPFCLSVCCVLWLVCDRIDIWFVGACHLYDWLWYAVSVILGGAFTVHCHPPAQQPRKSQTTHTHNRLTAFVHDYLGGLVPEETSPSHTHPDYRTSFINFLYLPRSIASSLFSLLASQSTFPQLLSRSSLVLLLVLDPLLHTLFISSSSYHLLFATHAHTIAACCTNVMSSVSNLSAPYFGVYLLA